MGTVECSVCGEEVGRGPAGLGLLKHSRMHRREFEKIMRREPESYEEVRQLFQSPYRQVTVYEALVDAEQQALVDYLEGQP